MTIKVLRKIHNKIKYDTVLHYLTNKLSYIGLRVEPYYLEKEQLFYEDNLNISIKPNLDSCLTTFFDEDDIKTIVNHIEHDASGDFYKFTSRIADGCLCFGVKHQGKIAAYTWCDLKRCNHEPLLFPLKEHEAYLFDAHTFKSYRGKNLAPYMRYQLYKHLTKMGRTVYYSYTSVFNQPAIKFKRKLKAEPLSLYLYINFLDKFERNTLLRNY